MYCNEAKDVYQDRLVTASERLWSFLPWWEKGMKCMIIIKQRNILNKFTFPKRTLEWALNKFCFHQRRSEDWKRFPSRRIRMLIELSSVKAWGVLRMYITQFRNKDGCYLSWNLVRRYHLVNKFSQTINDCFVSIWK